MATLLRQYQCDIRLVDALYLPPDVSLPRRRARILPRDEIAINYWRFGISRFDLSRQLMALKKQEWQPDDVYIESFTTIWWEGVNEAITLVREVFPRTRVIVYGAYPSFAPEEAQREIGADLLICDPLMGLAGLPLDLSLYPSHPRFTHLAIGTEMRPTQDLINEFLLKAVPTNIKERIRHFAFADHNAVHCFRGQFKGLLQFIIDKKISVSFYALCNLYSSDFIDDHELASLLFRADFKQVVLADDRDVPLTEEAREIYVEQCQWAIKRLRIASVLYAFLLVGLLVLVWEWVGIPLLLFVGVWVGLLFAFLQCHSEVVWLAPTTLMTRTWYGRLQKTPRELIKHIILVTVYFRGIGRGSATTHYLLFLNVQDHCLNWLRTDNIPMTALKVFAQQCGVPVRDLSRKVMSRRYFEKTFLGTNADRLTVMGLAAFGAVILGLAITILLIFVR